MPIYGINIKPFTTVFKKVEESLDTSKDGESRNFYQNPDQQDENLPEDKNELFELIKAAIKNFHDQDYVKEQGVQYVAVKEPERVFIVVRSRAGKEIRKMEPDEFLRVVKSSSSRKGTLINSIL